MPRHADPGWRHLSAPTLFSEKSGTNTHFGLLGLLFDRPAICPFVVAAHFTTIWRQFDLCVCVRRNASLKLRVIAAIRDTTGYIDPTHPQMTVKYYRVCVSLDFETIFRRNSLRNSLSRIASSCMIHVGQ